MIAAHQSARSSGGPCSVGSSERSIIPLSLLTGAAEGWRGLAASLVLGFFVGLAAASASGEVGVREGLDAVGATAGTCCRTCGTGLAPSAVVGPTGGVFLLGLGDTPGRTPLAFFPPDSPSAATPGSPQAWAITRTAEGAGVDSGLRPTGGVGNWSGALGSRGNLDGGGSGAVLACPDAAGPRLASAFRVEDPPALPP